MLSAATIVAFAAPTRAQEQALQQVLAGNLPAEPNAASALCSAAVQFAIAQQRYDQLPALLGRLKELAGKSATARAAAVTLLNHFGHAAAVSDLMPVGLDQARFSSGRVALSRTNFELQTRWAALSGSLKQVSAPEPVSAQDVQETLDLAARSGACISVGQSHWVSCQAMADRLMLALPQARLTAVRAAQDQAAERLVAAARLDTDAEAALAAWRRYPWSARVHELMAGFGEQALRSGRPQWAAAAFADVISHAADPALRGQAHVGLWLALAQQSQTRQDLFDAMAAVDDGTQLPWRGAQAPAGEIKKALLAGVLGHGQQLQEHGRDAHATKLADLPRRRILLPAPWTLEGRVGDGPVEDFALHTPWPISHVQTAGAALIVHSGNRVARFDAAAAAWACGENQTPLPWDANAARRYQRENPAADFQRRGASTADGESSAFSPDASILYYYQSDTTRPTIVAVSAATGKTLWTTADDEQFQAVRSQAALTIMSRPAAADGCVFALALGPADRDIGTAEDEGAAMMWYLLCLDGRSGRTLWKQAIGWQPFTHRDLARGGCAVTIHRGSVYCQTNMGLIARCDLRDGALIWTTGYANAVRAAPDSHNFARQGVSPVVVGGVLLAAPRDHSGVLAMRCDSGELLWQAPLTPSDRLLGAAGGVAVSMNNRWAAGIDIAKGTRRWITPLPQASQGRGSLIGDSAVIVAGESLVRIAAATGQIAERIDFPAGAAAQIVLLDDGTLLEAAAPPLAFARPSTPAGPDVPLGLPLEDALTLSCESPLLLTDPAAAETFTVLSGRTLAVAGAGAGVIWQRLLPTRPQGAIVEGRTIVLSGARSLEGFRATDGAPAWTAALPFAPARLGSGQGLVWAASGPGQPPAAAVVDPAGGNVLWAGLLTAAGVQGDIRDIALTDQGLVVRWPQVQVNGQWKEHGVSYHDPRSGQLRQARPAAPSDSPHRPPLESTAMRFIGRVAWLHATTLAGAAAAGWDMWFDQSIQDRYPSSVAMFPRGGRLYLHACGQVSAFDTATKRQTAYELQPRDLVRVCTVLDLREVAHTLVVLWASTGESLNADMRNGRLWYRPEDSRMYVDVFDLADGKRIARQELASLPFYDRGFGDFATRGVIFDRAVAVTAPDGVHLFHTHDGGGKAFAALTADVRDLAALAGKSPDIPAFDAATAKASAAARAFAADAASAALPADQRAALTASAAAGVNEIVQQAYRPVMTPPGGDYVGEVTVAISTAVRSAAVRYTLDSTDPLSAGQPYTAPLRLGAGTVVKAAAGAPGKTFATIPTGEQTYRILAARAADTPANVQPGLTYAYAGGGVKTVAELAALKVVKNGTCTNFDISPWTAGDNWGVTFAGYIRVPTDGVYTFYTTSDDGSCLFIGNARVADNDRRHPPQMASGQIALRAGLHPIRLAYFEVTACKLLKVEYSGPGIPRQFIPNDALFH